MQFINDSAVQRDLADVEGGLKQVLLTQEPLLEELTEYFNEAKGKRLRPLTVLLTGQLGEYRPDKLIPLAIAVEILHMATLVHDDIIDGADIRRGQRTVHTTWGEGIGLLLGDFFYAKSMSILSSTLPTARWELVLAITAMVEGEMEQQRDAFNLDISEDCYFHRIRKKTAALIRACCKVGGYVAGLRGKKLKALERYGEYVGMAFQIRDDYLDYSIQSNIIGKPLENDFSQGIVTLPLLHYMREIRISAADKQEIQKLMKAGRGEMHKEKNMLFQQIRDAGSLDYSMKMAEELIHNAMEQLKLIPSCDARGQLEDLAWYTLSRDS